MQISKVEPPNHWLMTAGIQNPKGELIGKKKIAIVKEKRTHAAYKIKLDKFKSEFEIQLSKGVMSNMHKVMRAKFPEMTRGKVSAFIERSKRALNFTGKLNRQAQIAPLVKQGLTSVQISERINLNLKYTYQLVSKINRENEEGNNGISK